MQSCLRISLAFVLAVLCVSVSNVSAQVQTPSTDLASDHEPTYSEYDVWRGSSLGIRIKKKDGNFTVSRVMSHLSDHPLHVGDQLLQVGEVDLTASPLSDLGESLKQIPPRTELAVKIRRDEQEELVSFPTYRHELVDIASIVERIQKNTIIKDHLEKLDRTSELDSLTQRMVDAVQSSRSPRQAHEGINQVIDEIGISHTAIVPRATFQQLVGKDGGELGLVLRRFEVNGTKGYFVVDFKPGTPAHGCEIQLGDQILFVNGVRIENSRRLVLAGEEQRYEVFTLDAKPGESVRIEHRTGSGGSLRSTTLETTGTISLQQSVSSSARVIESANRRVGYLRFWNLMSMDANRVLKKQLDSEFADCDALILDLRGRGGTIPSVIAIDRTISKLEIPVIAITDELTRSAKELLSFRLKLHEHVTVIGERTSGAVTAATFATLPSGNALMFPVLSSDGLKRYTEGTILEGRGVEPDEKVNFYEPFCNGVDQLLKVALERAVQAAQIDLP